MKDAEIADIARLQHNRFSAAQAITVGFSTDAIERRVRNGRWVRAEAGVFAIAPVLPDTWGNWMASTLTAPGTWLADGSASAAWKVLSTPSMPITVIREGRRGPQRFGNTLVRYSHLFEGEARILRDVPITSPERTLVDIAPRVSQKALARAVREAVRLEHTTTAQITDALLRHSGRRGIRKLRAVLARYAGLPLERARSGAEVRGLEVLRDAGYTLPRLNHDVAGEEADFHWPQLDLIVEIDGDPFHLDRGEDARKQRIWEEAGLVVRRIPSDHVYGRPTALLDLAAEAGRLPSR